MKQTRFTISLLLAALGAIVAPEARAQDVSPSPLDVRVVADEAEAALAILEARRAGDLVEEAAWERLFSTEGFRRLEARERSLEREVDRDEFRSWLLADSAVARADAYRETIAWWKALDANEPARRAFAYLPAGTTVRAKLYPMLKPTTNSFVFEISSDPAIFIYVDPDEPRPKVENTLAHELHHVGTAGAPACEPAGVDSLVPGARTAVDWLGGFAEGLAVLAAAGGPDVHPHAGRSNEEYVVWERDVASFAADLEALDRFFLDLVQGRLTDEAEVRRRGFAFITSEGIPQGPFYTVGWKMAAIVEKAEGRDAIVEAVCDPRLLLAAYDRVARANEGPREARFPTWSPALLEALGIQWTGSPRISGGAAASGSNPTQRTNLLFMSLAGLEPRSARSSPSIRAGATPDPRDPFRQPHRRPR